MDVNPTECFHDDAGLTYRKRNKVKDYVCQCCECGDQIGEPVSQDSMTLENRLRAKPFNWDAFWKAQRAKSEAEREVESALWTARYERHLSSPKWKELRERVIARCGGVCEGCRNAPAVHVHHLTYERMGREMLFDLVAVCIRCHQVIHPHREFDNAD